MSHSSRYYTRKEIAGANELSDDTIARRERRLGLHECRDQTCQKPIRYHRTPAAAHLRRCGYRVPEE